VVSAGEIDLGWTGGGGNETGIAIFRRTGTGAWRSAGLAPTVTGAGPQGALIPTGGELFIAAIDGTAAHSAKAVVSAGQSVTLKLVLKFPNGAVADVTADAHCAFGTGTAVGQFTAKNLWTARAQDVGKTVVISGSYRSPAGGKRIAGAVTVTVRATRRGPR
jgi:hypothetical protein